MKIVWILEAEANTLRVLAEIFARRGYFVSASSEREKFLELCKKAPETSRPDVIVINVGKNFDGIKTVGIIRATYPDYQNVPIILATGLPAEDFLQLAALVGADVLLQKPFFPHSVGLALVAAYSRRRNKNLRGLPEII